MFSPRPWKIRDVALIYHEIRKITIEALRDFLGKFGHPNASKEEILDYIVGELVEKKNEYCKSRIWGCLPRVILAVLKAGLRQSERGIKLLGTGIFALLMWTKKHLLVGTLMISTSLLWTYGSLCATPSIPVKIIRRLYSFLWSTFRFVSLRFRWYRWFTKWWFYGMHLKMWTGVIAWEQERKTKRRLRKAKRLSKRWDITSFSSDLMFDEEREDDERSSESTGSEANVESS